MCSFDWLTSAGLSRGKVLWRDNMGGVVYGGIVIQTGQRQDIIKLSTALLVITGTTHFNMIALS